MDFNEIRRLTIVALFSDDKLMEQLVLKGGNAISLVYGYGLRSSLDLDFSIDQDFADFEETKERIFAALKDRFSSGGFLVFDENFEPRPFVPDKKHPEQWGGYELKFKLIENSKYAGVKDDLETMRRNALEVGPAQKKTFTVQMSKFEYCRGKTETELDHYTIYVYTPAMIVIEKLRAICQQMPEYALRSHPVARARDFYDIHLVMTKENMNLASQNNLELLPHIFAAKKVPMPLIAKIRDQREFHRPDWPAVQNSVAGRVEEFDFYFDFVAEKIVPLKPLWGI